jgi:DNA-binding response OmpR family regulator
VRRATEGTLGRMGDVGTRRVLLVEDDEPIREAVEEVLKDEGCAVVSTATLVEARAALTTGAFDVMLLDLMLEDGSGEDLLEELKAKSTRLPTVIMSASTRAQATALAFGAELLRKPFEIETLLVCVETALGKKA